MNARLGVAAALLLAAGNMNVEAADAKKGQQLFITYGCYGCHGYNGQGGNAGVKLAPDPKPVEAIAAFIRNASSTLMPPYAESSVSDADIADIHAWLAAQPKVDPKSIAILKD